MHEGLVSSEEEAKKQVGSLWSYINGKETDLFKKLIVTKSDIAPKLKDISLYDNFDADGLLKELQWVDTEVKAGTNTWQNYYKAIKDQPEMDWVSDFIQNNDLTTVSIEQVEEAQNNARQSAIAYNNGLEQMTLGARVTNVALRTLSAVVSTIAITAIAQGISTIVESVVNANERYLESQQKLIDGCNEEISAIDNEISSLETLQKKLQDARGDSSKLVEIQNDLNRAIGDTPRLLETEGNAWDVANQKIQDRIDKLQEYRRKKAEEKVDAQENVFNNNTVNNDNGWDETLSTYFGRGWGTWTSAGGYSGEDYKTVITKLLPQVDDEHTIGELLSDYLRNNTTGNIGGLPNEAEINEYFGNQKQLILDIYGDFIDDLDTSLPKESIEDVLNNLVMISPDNIQNVKSKFGQFIDLLADSGFDETYNEYLKAIKNNDQDGITNGFNELHNILEKLTIDAPSADTALASVWKDIEIKQASALDTVEAYNNVLDKAKEKDNSFDWNEWFASSGIDTEEEYNKFIEYLDKFGDAAKAREQYYLDTRVDFSEAFKSLAEDDSKALKEMALSGEITPEVLTSTAAYRKLLEDTGLTAEEACEKIHEFAVGETSLSDIMSSIKSHAELINSVNEQLAENGQIGFDTLQNIAKEYPTLEEYVQEYLTGVEGSEQKLIDELNRCYNADLDTYKKYYEVKLSNDELWWNNFTDKLPNWVSELTKYYGIDLKEYTSYLKAKAALEVEYEKTSNFIKLAAEDSNPNSDDRKYSKTKHPFLLVNQTKEATLDVVNKDVESTDVLEDLYMKQKDLASALDEITKNFESNLDLGDIDSKFNPTSFTGGSKKSSSKPTVFDWIETKIENVSEALDNLKSNSSNTYATWTERNNALQKAISETKDAIALQAQAYQTYMNKANSVGLSDYYKNLVQNGALMIDDIADDTIAEKISEYQKWYDKAKECRETQEDLNQTISELNKQNFTDLQSQFDETNDKTEHSLQLLQDQIDLLEMKGLFANEKYYNSMLDYTQEHIDSLEKEKSQLKSILNGSGIKQDTSEWHDMFSALMDIDEELSSLNNQMVEYRNTIRDLNWETFEYLENSIQRITGETEYLIDILSNEELFDDNGKMTEYGTAAIGLHAAAYDVYKQQAQDYYEEIQEYQKQLVNDAGKDVLEHYNDLVDSHRDAILAAEDEKQAILDLIEDGYNSQLDALQELIDKRKEALNAEKSLYDYQKNVKEQADNITSLEKQKMAYEGDDSESAMSKIQQIKVDLENAKADLKETEYEKYLSDTEDLLDQLSDEYETWMNERLDNSDALLSEIAGEVSTKGEQINDTLSRTADKYGTIVSDSITSIFNSESPFTSALTGIGDDIQDVGTGISTSISGTTAAINNLIDKIAGITGAGASKASSGNNISSGGSSVNIKVGN